MAKSSGFMIMQNRTQAQFQDWIQQFEAALAGGGLVQTLDTGQINSATVAVPTVANQFMGYQIWRLNDTIQAERPVFIKIEYGSGVNQFAGNVRVTVGTSTNGAGVLGGMATGAPTMQMSPQLVETQAQPWYSYGDLSSFSMAFGTSRADLGWRPSFFTIERTRDTTGVPNSDGWVFFTTQGFGWNTGSASYGDTNCYLGSYTTNQIHSQICLPVAHPGMFGYWDGTGQVGNDLNIFPLLVSTPKPQGQMLNALAVYANAMPGQSTVPIVVSGASRTYLALGTQFYAECIPGPYAPPSQGSVIYGANSGGVTSVLMRWE